MAIYINCFIFYIRKYLTGQRWIETQFLKKTRFISNTIMDKHHKLREGYTTGTCAAGAAKGAAFGLAKGRIPDYVDIITPVNKLVKLKIKEKHICDNYAECCVKKDAGDDPDVTHGASIFCRLQDMQSELQNSQKKGTLMQKIVIEGGKGVGRVTKPGLQVAIGEPAINPVPRQMINDAISDVFSKNEYFLKATIHVPNGNKIAERTFNNRLGIYGGISIIGTTGFVRPMSEEAIKTSLKCELDIAKAEGFTTVILVPGNLAETAVKKAFKLKKEQVVLMSNFVGFMLTTASNHGFIDIILAGHPGKLAKLVRGDFNTHSSMSKQANDIIINLIKSEGIEQNVIDIIKNSTTVEGMLQEIRKIDKLHIFNKLAETIAASASSFLKHKHKIGVILFDMTKRIVGLSRNAEDWKKGL